MTLALSCASSIAALFLATLSFHAAAQIDGVPCTGAPGERRVGVTPPQQGSVPLCVQDGVNPRQPPQRQQDPAFMMADALVQLYRAQSNQLEQLAKNPKFKKLLDGYWVYIEPKKGAPADQQACMAIFADTNGLIYYMAGGGPDEPLAVAFEGPKIPKPDRPRQLRVAVRSSELAPVKVKADNVVFPDSTTGALIVGIGGTVKSALEPTEDRETFGIEYKGDTIFKGGFHSGLEMKKKLMSCVEKKVK